MAKYRRFLLTEVSFIGGTLLVPGSVVTSEDLGEYKDPEGGKLKPVRPPASSIEIDANGQPVSSDDAESYTALVGSLPTPAAQVQPFAPGGGVASPTQAPGGPSIAANQLAQPSPVAPSRRGGNGDVNKAAEDASAALAAKADGEGSKG